MSFLFDLERVNELREQYRTKAAQLRGETAIQYLEGVQSDLLEEIKDSGARDWAIAPYSLCSKDVAKRLVRN